MDTFTAYAGLLFRALLSVGILFFLLISLALLFNRGRGKNVMARLVNASNGDEIDISAWEISLGRAKTCDIVLNYPTVSRFHAVIVRRGKGWIIFDTGSKTGIRVNGEKIDRRAFIYDGDMIALGTALLRFSSPLFVRPETASAPSARRAERRSMSPDYFDSPPRDYAPPRSRAPAIDALINLSDDSPILLFSDVCTVGRAPDCDIVLPVMTVSKRHARLEKRGSVRVISDLGSRSGTRLNGGVLVEPIPLRDGDVINIGGIRFRYAARYVG